MKCKIIRCTGTEFCWYRDMVGQVVEVELTTCGDFVHRLSSGHWGVILRSDVMGADDVPAPTKKSSVWFQVGLRIRMTKDTEAWVACKDILQAASKGINEAFPGDVKCLSCIVENDPSHILKTCPVGWRPESATPSEWE